MILQVMEIQTVLTKGARLVQIISYLGKVSRLQGDLLVSKSQRVLAFEVESQRPRCLFWIGHAG